MNDSPEEIRSDIERTRTELSGDVDALVDKVTPSKIAQRQTNRMKGAMRSMKDKVMGVAEDVGDSVASAAGRVQDAAGSAGESLADMPKRATAKAEGNPLAVGLIAFGLGMLASSLIPASAKEQEAAERLKEKAQPLMDEVTHAAQESAEHLREPAMDAANAVKDAAGEAVDAVRSEASGAAGEVRDQAQQARDELAGG